MARESLDIRIRPGEIRREIDEVSRLLIKLDRYSSFDYEVYSWLFVCLGFLSSMLIISSPEKYSISFAVCGVAALLVSILGAAGTFYRARSYSRIRDKIARELAEIVGRVESRQGRRFVVFDKLKSDNELDAELKWDLVLLNDILNDARERLHTR